MLCITCIFILYRYGFSLYDVMTNIAVTKPTHWVFMVISFLTTLFRVVFLFSILWFPFYFFDEKIWFLRFPVDKLIKYRLDF